MKQGDFRLINLFASRFDRQVIVIRGTTTFSCLIVVVMIPGLSVAFFGKRAYGWLQWRVWALASRHLWSARGSCVSLLLLFNLIYLDHVIDLLYDPHFVWDHLFQLLDLLRLLDLKNLATWCLSEHKCGVVVLIIRFNTIFSTCMAPWQKVYFVYIHRCWGLIWQRWSRLWSKWIVGRWPCNEIRESWAVLPLLLNVAAGVRGL